MNNPKYLVRPSDFHIVEVDESNGAYRSYTSRDVSYSDGTRPKANPYFTYENLTYLHSFFPIEEHELRFFEQMGNDRREFFAWQDIPGGYGGIKGGTWKEFFEYRKRKFMNDLTDNMATQIANDVDEAIARKITATFDLDIND